MFIGRNRLICVFKSFVLKNDALGDHITLFEPKYRDKCTRQDFDDKRKNSLWKMSETLNESPILKQSETVSPFLKTAVYRTGTRGVGVAEGRGDNIHVNP